MVNCCSLEVAELSLRTASQSLRLIPNKNPARALFQGTLIPSKDTEPFQDKHFTQEAEGGLI